MTGDLFAAAGQAPEHIAIAEGVHLLQAFVDEPEAAALMVAVDAVLQAAPLRRMETPGGYQMSVAMSNCGPFGWVTDRRGYRYQPDDPLSGQPWPALPTAFADLAGRAAAVAGFADFVPDACLINCYAPGARMSLHQDKNERDMRQPIVSVSLGLPATFFLGGLQRNVRPRRMPLTSGDVVVWGGPARLLFHGVDTVADGSHPLTGRCRFNLTFRRAC